MKRIVSLFVAIALTITALFLTSTPAIAAQTIADPSYKSSERVSDEGLEYDYIYTFSDGNLNSQYDEPILMVNGTFYASTPLIRTHRSVYAPSRGVAEALDAKVTWDATEKK